MSGVASDVHILPLGGDTTAETMARANRPAAVFFELKKQFENNLHEYEHITSVIDTSALFKGIPGRAVACELLLAFKDTPRTSVVFYDVDPTDGLTKTGVLKRTDLEQAIRTSSELLIQKYQTTFGDAEFCDDRLAETLKISFLSGTDVEDVAKAVLPDLKGMSKAEIEEKLAETALNYYDQEHRRGSDRKNMRGGIGVVTISDDLFKEDLLQGMLRMRALINEEHKDFPHKVHAVVPQAVAVQIKLLREDAPRTDQTGEEETRDHVDEESHTSLEVSSHSQHGPEASAAYSFVAPEADHSPRSQDSPPAGGVVFSGHGSPGFERILAHASAKEQAAEKLSFWGGAVQQMKLCGTEFAKAACNLHGAVPDLPPGSLPEKENLLHKPFSYEHAKDESIMPFPVREECFQRSRTLLVEEHSWTFAKLGMPVNSVQPVVALKKYIGDAIAKVLDVKNNLQTMGSDEVIQNLEAELELVVQANRDSLVPRGRGQFGGVGGWRGMFSLAGAAAAPATSFVEDLGVGEAEDLRPKKMLAATRLSSFVDLGVLGEVSYVFSQSHIHASLPPRVTHLLLRISVVTVSHRPYGDLS